MLSTLIKYLTLLTVKMIDVNDINFIMTISMIYFVVDLFSASYGLSWNDDS